MKDWEEQIESLQHGLKELVYGLACTALKAVQDTGVAVEGGAKAGVPFSNMTMSQWTEAVKLWLRDGKHLIEELPGRKCPACDGSEHRVLFTSYDGYPFAECSDCRCWYIPKVVDDELFDRFFASSPDAKKLADQMIVDRSQGAARKTDIDRISEYLNELKILLEDNEDILYLDTGCGLGHSLLAAQECGIKAVGVDTEQTSIRLARDQGLQVYHVDEELPEDKFHLLTFWESLEHMPDPKRVIKKYTEVLADDGLVAITVPNLNSFAIRVMRGDCSYVHGGVNWPGHMNLFNKECLAIMLEECGLEVISVDSQYSDNLQDIVAYVLGKGVAAIDLINGKTLDQGLSRTIAEILGWVGPIVSVLQRITCTAPILKVIACRVGRKEKFTNSAQVLDVMRKNEIENELKTMLYDASIDRREKFNTMMNRIIELEEGIRKRDDLLRKTQEEVNRRDRLLAEVHNKSLLRKLSKLFRK